jgi:hypothetical protein
VNQDLESDISPRFNRWEWRLQRVGWVLGAVFLLAAIAGLFGGGLLSQATTRNAGDGYEVALEYPRFGRAESTLTVNLEVMAPARADSEVTAVLSGGIVERAVITDISPEPASEAIAGGSIVLTWQVDDWSRPLKVRFEYESRHWRTLDGVFEIETDDNPLGRVQFEQFLFP